MIEQLARSSALGLRTGTTADVQAGLADLHARHAQHRHRTRLAAVAAVVLAVSMGAGAATVLGADHRAATPSSPLPTPHGRDLACQVRGIQCLGDRTYRFALRKPVVWELPTGFDADSGPGVEPLRVQTYQPATPTTGITVLERVRASSPDGEGPAPGVADDPHAFVSWVASRPYLDAGPVTRTTLDGHAAWRVRVKPGQRDSLRSLACNAGPCHLITYQPDGATTGIWGSMASQYIAFRLPGGGTTVVWSWMSTADTDDLDALEDAVKGVSWPVG
jgi:hypothetical protein